VAADTAGVVAAAFAEADRRDPHHQRTWIALAGGNKDQIRQIHAQAAARTIHVTITCDLCRARNYAGTRGRRCRKALRGRVS
jgi:hypothetical protein